MTTPTTPATPSLHPVFAEIFATHARATKAVTPTYRGWQLQGFDYGYYTATHPDFEASYQGPEDGWVGSHPTMQGRTPEELRAEIDAWFEEQGS